MSKTSEISEVSRKAHQRASNGDFFPSVMMLRVNKMNMIKTPAIVIQNLIGFSLDIWIYSINLELIMYGIQVPGELV